MTDLRAKLCIDSAGNKSLKYNCPACNGPHVVPIGVGSWEFNGNYNLPTLHPSVNVNNDFCHAIIKDGKAYFAETSKNGFAGKILELPLLW